MQKQISLPMIIAAILLVITLVVGIGYTTRRGGGDGGGVMTSEEMARRMRATKIPPSPPNQVDRAPTGGAFNVPPSGSQGSR